MQGLLRFISHGNMSIAVAGKAKSIKRVTVSIGSFSKPLETGAKEKSLNTVQEHSHTRWEKHIKQYFCSPWVSATA